MWCKMANQLSAKICFSCCGLAVSGEDRFTSVSSMSEWLDDGGTVPPVAHRAVSFEFLHRYAYWLRKWIGMDLYPTVSTHDIVHGVGAVWGKGKGGRGCAPDL